MSTPNGTKYDPSKAIDFSSTPKQHLFGWFGVSPSRPCDSCGGEYFYATDWNLGYRCSTCGTVFGTQEEWNFYK